MADFVTRLRSGAAITADGSMGAVLAGASRALRCPEEANVQAPESVVAVHVSYIRAGAELIETNTFGASRRRLGVHRLEDEFERINSAGVRLAREAREVSGRPVWIGGAIGPLGELEVFDPSDHRPLYAEQAQVLAARGVDVFVLETFFDLDDLVSAVEAVQSVSSLPVVAMLSFDEDAETSAGVGAADAARRLAELGVVAAGANHGVGPHAALEALAAMQHAGIPLAAMPNIGLASIQGGSVVYPHSHPDYFAEFAAQARQLGARIVGGCCGTTPAQVEAIREALAEERPPRVTFERDTREQPPVQTPLTGETELARCFRAGEWVVSVELDPPKGGNGSGLIDVAQQLQASGLVGFVDVNDNPMARARMNALMASSAIQRHADIETIPHVTPRDTTVMGLEGVLLGAHSDGVRNILAVTGDPPHVGDYPGSRGVYEIDAIGLVQLISRLNEGVDYVGKAIDQPTEFFVGVAVNPTADDLPLELDRFERKLAAGARFAMTQALFDRSQLEPLLDHYDGTIPLPLLAGVWPLRSHALALRLHNEVPGISVPDHVLEALDDAGPDAPSVGLALARQLIDDIRDLVAGIYIVPPFKQPLAALELLR